MRILIISLLIIHGLIHLLGYLKAFGFADIQELSISISRSMGLLWLFICLLFVVSAFLMILNLDAWWMPAIPALVLSQVLIIMYWQDAKFGTVANLILFIAALISWGHWQSERRSAREISNLLSEVKQAEMPLTNSQLSTLPDNVRHWIERSNRPGKPIPQIIHLKQSGKMKTSPNGSWMKVDAEQWFTTNPPGFIWTAEVGKNSYLSFYGRDKYTEGKGQMLIELYNLIPVVQSEGYEISQGTLIRYLSEMVWFPAAAALDNISWESIDSRSAKATLTVGQIHASGRFYFNQQGDPIAFEAKRYYNRKGTSTLERWHIDIDPKGYQSFEGIRIPTKASVTWKLDEGDFTWYELSIDRIRYDEHPDDPG